MTDIHPGRAIHGVSLLTEEDIYLFKQGRHYKLYLKLGAHLLSHNGEAGTLFAVWAPNAEAVSVVGDFNGWSPGAHPMAPRPDESGIWECFIPWVGRGALYKYHVASRFNGFTVEKGDPFAFCWETPPSTASRVWDLDYEWGDREWMASRYQKNGLDRPISVYEMHMGSWRRVPEDGNRSLSYRETAAQLADHLADRNFTHVEFMPVMEHPFYGSWGYQTTGYFAPTARYGQPQDFMYLMDALHRRGIGVWLDWVPSHFPTDAHGLAYFDGTHLFEHEDPRQGFHPDWKSFIFNYGRSEVQSFLVSSAMFWCDAYHADGLRMDAVASMIYLDYSRQGGEWVPNQYGGRENLEALQFIREMNQALYREFPDIQTAAEESTDWPMVSRPLYVGGLGFGMKWNMGWMHDTLDYFQKEPVYRKYHQNQLTFSIWYAFSENFMLPLSHDEVVYGKGSILGKMPGDGWQKFANLRLLYGYMWTHPGKKLLFMGDEFGQGLEWDHEGSLSWHQLEHENHKGIMRFVEDLNRLYREETALFELDFHPDGFQWVDFRDAEASVMSYLRLDRLGREVLVILNFTPVPRPNYRIGVPRAGVWHEVLNSDAPLYGGSGWGNLGALETAPVPSHGHFDSLSLVLPPLSALVFRPEDRTPRQRGGQVSKEAEFLYASIKEGGGTDGEGP